MCNHGSKKLRAPTLSWREVDTGCDSFGLASIRANNATLKMTYKMNILTDVQKHTSKTLLPFIPQTSLIFERGRLKKRQLSK